MKIRLGITLLGLVLGLSACGHQPAPEKTADAEQSQQTQSTKAASSTTSSQTATSLSSSKATQAPWTPAQATQLAAFMQRWGETMGQDYRSYWLGSTASFYGVEIPAGFDTMVPAMNDQPLDYELAADGVSTHAYAVVAIYSDTETAGYARRHLYLFTLHHGQPEVLVTMQNQGNENNWLYFTLTQNADLQNGFAAIVDG